MIDDDSRTVVWKSDSLPDSVPDSYSLSDIAALTRGYISGYPTFPAEAESGLLGVGFPKTSFWKHIWPSWDYQLIAHAPQIALARSCLQKGGEPDLAKAAGILIDDFRGGRLGRITLELPPEK